MASKCYGPRAPVLEITDEQWHIGLEVAARHAVIAPAIRRHRPARAII
jgi:hypothetical protein